MSTLAALIGQDYSHLLQALASTVEDLISVQDELAYLRATELEQQHLAWNNTPDDSIQKRDRAAKYSSSASSAEIFRVEGQRDALVERKFFIIRLLDGMNGHHA